MPKTAQITDAAPTTPYDLRVIPIELIRHNTVNPRRRFDPIRQAELVASIREKGIETPLLVRPVLDGLFEIVAGERRARAAETLNLVAVPCHVKPMSDDEALASGIVENIQRHDMNVMDEASGYARLQKADARVYTVAGIARRVGQPESRVYKLLKLTTLEKAFQEALAEDRLTMGHAERLLRLTPAQRKDAMDDDLVWRMSPLFDERKKWIPSKDELQPVSQLDWFIQRHAAFDPNAEDLQHFLPDVAAAREAAIDEALADRDEVEDVEGGPAPTLLQLSDDSLVRVKLGAKQGDKATPLSPSKWKTVKPGSCEHAQLGAVTHGGKPRVLTVCIKRSCAKHWPQPKKKPAAKAATSTKPAAPKESSWDRDRRLAEVAKAEWAPIWPRVKQAFIEHLEQAKLKPTAAFFRTVLRQGDGVYSWVIDTVKREFGIEFTDKTVLLVFALTTATGIDTRQEFLDVAKLWKFNLGPTEQAIKREQAAAAKKSPTSGSAEKRKNAKKSKAAA